MDLSSKWNISSGSSGSSGSSYHKNSDNRISVGKNKTAVEDDIWGGRAAAPPTTPPPYFGRICPLSTTQHDLYLNRTNKEGFTVDDEARTRKVDNISLNIQNELKKKRKAEEEARIAYEKGKTPVSTPSGNVISSNNSFSDRVTSSYINLNKRASGIISLVNSEINGNIKTIGNTITGNTNLNEFTLSDKVGGAGITMKIKKNGEIVIQDLDKLNFGIFDWINYVVDSSYNGVDANNNPVYIIVPDFADAELERELELNTKGLSEINIGGQGCALGQRHRRHEGRRCRAAETCHRPCRTKRRHHLGLLRPRRS